MISWPASAALNEASPHRVEKAIPDRHVQHYDARHGESAQQRQDVATVPARVDAVLVLHTVLLHPTPGQKSLLEQIVTAANAVVTMTETAHDRLLGGCSVDRRKISVIPQGTTDYSGTAAVWPSQASPACSPRRSAPVYRSSPRHFRTLSKC
jgi:hypothetical protein